MVAVDVAVDQLEQADQDHILLDKGLEYLAQLAEAPSWLVH